jgi:hypothetical protein
MNATQVKSESQIAFVPSVFVPSKLDPIAYLLSRKGQIVTITACRSCKTRKGVSSVVTKRSTFQSQVGVDYNSKAIVQAKRESGELPSEPQPLPWGQWEVFPYVIEHKGKRYFRLYNVRNDFVPAVQYYLDGIPVSKSVIAPLCLASEFAERTGDCFTYPIEGIETIH